MKKILLSFSLMLIFSLGGFSQSEKLITKDNFKDVNFKSKGVKSNIEIKKSLKKKDENHQWRALNPVKNKNKSVSVEAKKEENE